MPETLIFQFRHRRPEEPTLAEVMAAYGLEAEDVDASYGVVKVADDGEGALYSILVTVAARAKVEARLATEGARDPAVGLFANPRIETFGPPEQ
jgi:hypothetical protein